MEHFRLIAAIVLSLAVFLIYDLVFVDRRDVPPLETQREAVEETRERPDRPDAVDETRPQPIAELPDVPEKTFETITVHTPLYEAEISEMGAALRRLDLNEYFEHTGPDSPRKAMIPVENPIGTGLVEISGTEEPLYRQPFATDFEESSLTVYDESANLSFFLQSDDGLVLEKRYTFHPDRYNIDMRVVVRNESDSIADRELTVLMTNPPPPDQRRFTFSGPFVHVDGNLEEVDIKDIADNSTYSGTIGFAGLQDTYFMTTLIPRSPADTSIILNEDAASGILRIAYQQPMDLLAPGSQVHHDFHLFMGPKKLSLLRDFGQGLDQVVNFGIFSFIATPALWLMNFIHDNIVANFGVAIILITLLIKVIFWPLGNKSYKSMAEMRKLQPLMMEIREKHKDDKRKMNEEVMNLYKTYKINPLSGCLPMVVQIPVFIAFYRMLYEAIELRHASFMLWINDLSVPDRLFNFDITIPLMAPPYGIPVLTLIMGASMFLQQRLAPPPGDPMQARIMMMLPIVFTFIFINFPSGLVLYWLVNNLVSIGQQYHVNRKYS